MKVVSGISLLLLSFNVLASFQSQISVGYLSEDGKWSDSDVVNLDYLYLFSPVEENKVPYAEQVFVSQENQFSVGLLQKKTVYNEDPITGDFSESDFKAYNLNVIYYMPETSFFLGLGYKRTGISSKVIDKDGDGIVYISNIEVVGTKGDEVALQLGYYIDSMSRLSLLLSRYNMDYDFSNLDVASDSTFYAIEYRRLFHINETYLSMNGSVARQDRVLDSLELGNLGMDSRDLKAELSLSYYIKRATSITAGASVIKNKMLERNVENTTHNYSVNIEHYFNPVMYASIGYIDFEYNDSDRFTLNAGYRF